MRKLIRIVGIVVALIVGLLIAVLLGGLRLPEEHHAWLAQVTAAIMLRKVSPDLSKAALEDLDKQLSLEVQPEIAIRQVQESLPVDEYTLP